MNLLDRNADAEDAQVIAAISDGDVNAYSILIVRYQKAVFNLMLRMTGSYEDAADLAQETFIKAYDQLYRFQKGKKFFPWLYTIGLNHARNFLRSNRRTHCVSLEDREIGSGLDYPGQQEDGLCTKLDYARLHAALDRLPLDYREALILRYHEGLSMEDVAAALKLKLSAAKMRVHRGLAKLRDMLEKKQNGKEGT
jgi:RNA polymerase sigma-70 factor, ECF subfamily